MFRPRSPFTPPQTNSNSGRPKQPRAMSIQEPQWKVEVKPQTNDLKLHQGLSATTPSTMDEKFCFSLQNPIQGDDQIYWSYELSSQVSNQTTRRLIFRQQQYFTKGTTQSDIYQTIYIIADGVNGFKNQNGVTTNRVCALHLCEIQSIIDDADTKTYDLLYKQHQDLSWQIPMNLGQLNFKIQCENQTVQLKSGPLSIPLVCQFDIRHVGK